MTKIYPDTQFYHYHNENPKNRKTGDCVFRAIASLTKQSWDDTIDGLVAIAHKTKYCPNSVEGFGRYLESLGYIKHSQLRHDDNTKYTGKEFCKYLTNVLKVPVVANIGGHHTTYFGEIDGVYKCFDIWDPTNGTVGNFWYKPNNR